MQNHTIESSAAAVPNGVQLCDRPNCGEPAVYSYSWEWGENGLCCGKHHFELNQAAGQLNRSIQCTPLAAGIATPLERPERVQLIAARLAAEAELEEAKSRGLDLYNQNTQLTGQVQALSVRNRESDAQLRDAKIAHADMQAELERRRAEHGNLADEVSRLRVLVPRPGAADLAAAAQREQLALLQQQTTTIKERDEEIGRLKTDLQRLGAELDEATKGSKTKK